MASRGRRTGRKAHVRWSRRPWYIGVVVVVAVVVVIVVVDVVVVDVLLRVTVK